MKLNFPLRQLVLATFMETKIVCHYILATGFYLFCPVLSHAAPPEVVISSTTLPGRTVRIDLDRLAPGAALNVEWNKKSYRLYSLDPDSARALIGIPLGTKPDTYPLSFRPRAGTEQRQALPESLTLQVEEREYPIDTVNFPDSKTRMFNEAQERREGKKIHQVLLQSRPDQLWEGVFDPPVSGPVVGIYGTKRIRNKTIEAGFHKGIDLKSPAGTPVKAANNGIVVLASPFKIHGRTVIIDHGQGVMSLYLHMKSFSVHPGQRVVKGESVGKVGSTGLSTAPHVHWGVYVHGVPVDPDQWTSTEF